MFPEFSKYNVTSDHGENSALLKSGRWRRWRCREYKPSVELAYGKHGASKVVRGNTRIQESAAALLSHVRQEHTCSG